MHDEYAIALDSLSDILKQSYASIRDLKPSIDKKDYSKLVINRLRAFYHAQAETKDFLNKRIAQPGDHFFVETIVFALKLFCDIEKLNLEIASERTIKHKRKSIRPDISIWTGDKLIGAIECKTQLGYQRNSWDNQLQDRATKIRLAFPEAKLFLLVMTSVNWSSFGDDPRVGTELFCLLNEVWPAFMSKDFDESIILNPIEPLLEQVKDLADS
jgi:hypothetical protein